MADTAKVIWKGPLIRSDSDLSEGDLLISESISTIGSTSEHLIYFRIEDSSMFMNGTVVIAHCSEMVSRLIDVIVEDWKKFNVEMRDKNGYSIH